MFSDALLNDIRSKCDIVELVGRYVQLKKSGQGYQGLCPFHNEKTPSFNVHPTRQIYKCFGGCGKGGNVFTFLMDLENLSFPEAVKRLANEVGVKVEEERNYTPQPAAKPLGDLDKRALLALEWAAKYFNYLLTQDPQYAFAKKYVEGRGLTARSIDKFRLGVSPRGWNTLIGMMQKRGYKWEELLTAGLVVPKDDAPNQGYDRFRGRLMFPILDKEGRVAGFGARALAEEDQPKYLNSPDTPLFNKSRLLYGLFENQRDIRIKGEAIVVEGYMDVVGLYEAGVNNAVAPMGTALTPEHCKELKPISNRVVTVFDPDQAGINAWHRTVHLLMENAILAKDVTLPEGLDPDEFVKQQSAEAFYTLCDQAPSQVTKYVKEIASKGVLGEKERNKYLQELTPILLASRRQPDRGALLWDDVARVLNVSFDALKRLTEDAANRLGKSQTETAVRPTPRPSPSQQNSSSKKFPLDWGFFKEALRWPKEFLEYPKENWLGFLKESRLETLLVQLWDTRSVSAMTEMLEKIALTEADSELVAALTTGVMADLQDTKKEPSFFAEVAQRIAGRKRDAEIRALGNQIRLSQRMGNAEEQAKLLEELKNLRTEGAKSLPRPLEPSSH